MGWKARLAILGAALAAGLAGGLLLAWTVAPAAEYQTRPAALGTADKMVYLALAGDLYAGERDLERARQRLAALDVPADGSWIAAQIEQYVDGGGDLDDVRNLARLAQDLGATGGILLVFGPPADGPAAAVTGSGRLTPSPAPAESPTPVPSDAGPAGQPAFRLVEQTATCGRPGQPGRIAVRVRDAQGQGLSGVEVTVAWALGEDRFFTGLRPELGPGYADFQMSPGNDYEVSLQGVPAEVAHGLLADLSSGICPSTSLSLDWQVVFEQKP